jgi:hypothetical protein
MVNANQQQMDAGAQYNCDCDMHSRLRHWVDWYRVVLLVSVISGSGKCQSKGLRRNYYLEGSRSNLIREKSGRLGQEIRH